MVHLALIAGLALTVATVEYEPRTPTQKIRLQLELVDGSKLFGEPVDSSSALRLHSRFGQFTLSLEKVEGFEIQQQGEKILLQWSDGDRLTASPGNECFLVRTLVGEVKVPLTVVRRGKVEWVEAGEPLRPVDVNSSGQWHTQPLRYAHDGSHGSAWSSGSYTGWIEYDLGAPRELASVHAFLQYAPSGPGTHQIYVSQQPMRGIVSDGRLLQKFDGRRKDRDVLTARCPPGVIARYVQVRCTSGTGWFNIRELEIYAGEDAS